MTKNFSSTKYWMDATENCIESLLAVPFLFHFVNVDARSLGIAKHERIKDVQIRWMAETLKDCSFALKAV